MAAMYRVKSAFLKTNPNAVTLFDGVPVALSGKDLTITKPGTVTHPPTSKTVKGATSAQLKHLFEVERNPHIEKIDE